MYSLVEIRDEDSCDDPKLISGCNIVDRSSCKCESAHVCVDDHPFDFRTRQECLMNLDAMLKRDGDDYDNGDILNDEGKRKFYALSYNILRIFAMIKAQASTVYINARRTCIISNLSVLAFVRFPRYI